MKRIPEILYKKPFWLFLIFLFAAYLPVILPFFHLKNDILTQNLPTRFVFSESLYSGFEPYWNPFIHFGIPQYGDMNNGFWNPMQWLIGSTVGYNIYSITLEELFYILIGGWGMYKMSKEIFTKDVALITGLTYMCCGYLTGHLQYLCWITGTAFFPYVLLYFIRLNKNPIVKNFLLGGISVFLFVASTHPGLIIGAAYFFAFSLLIIYLNRKGFLKSLYHPKFWMVNSLFLIISLLLSIVVIWSNLDVLPQISRGTIVSLEQTLWTPTTPQSYMSVFLPLPVHKTNFFNTDISMRNVYIGVAHFAGIILLARFLTRRMFFSIAIPLVFFVLLSAGGYFKTFAWQALPLTGFVRLNGEFTYFVILILLLSGAAGIQSLIKEKISTSGIGNLFFWICAVAAAFSIVFILSTKSSVLFQDIQGSDSLKNILKSFIANTSFWDLLFIQAAIQGITIFLIHRFFSNKSILLTLLCINLIITTWFTLPFTGLGAKSKKQIQSVINTFPRGITPQPLIPINEASYIKPEDEMEFMLISSYSKKIGYTKPDLYPIQLNKNIVFYNDTSLYSFIKKQSFLFLSTDTIINTATNFDSTHILVLRSGPGYTKCMVKNNNYNWITLLQNNYKYWKVKIDGKTTESLTGFKTFISVPIKPGQHIVEFYFDPRPIKTVLWINLFLFLVVAVVLCFPKLSGYTVFRSSSPSLPY